MEGAPSKGRVVVVVVVIFRPPQIHITTAML